VMDGIGSALSDGIAAAMIAEVRSGEGHDSTSRLFAADLSGFISRPFSSLISSNPHEVNPTPKHSQLYILDTQNRLDHRMHLSAEDEGPAIDDQLLPSALYLG
jgi:hypothetical protein